MSATDLQGPVEVDPRIAARRDAVVADRRRRRRQRLAILAIVVTAVAALYGLTRTPLFDVEAVQVEGAARTPVDDVRAATGIRPGDALLDVDTGAAADAVASLPWVADVDVERGLDGQVVVRLTERTPLAAVADPYGGRSMVDADGRVLERLPADPSAWPPGLVALDGVTAPDAGEDLGPEATPALDVVGSLTPGLRARVLSVVVEPDGTLGLRLIPEGTVDLGPPAELDTKLASLVTLLAQVDQTCLGEIDLTVADLATLSRTC